MSENNIIAKICSEQAKSDVPEFKTGDTLKVHIKITEGTKERIQVFQGIVIATKSGNSAGATFTVRKMSYNIGVEKTFLLHSPRIAQIEVVSFGDVRRAKLYYLRDRSGKAARVKTKLNYGQKGAEPAPTKEATTTADKSKKKVATSAEAPAA